MNQPVRTDRLDYLDAVRAFALLLGIVFHASLSFVPIFIGWAVMDISTSPGIGSFVLISHSFRMELFFLIAGFFSHMAFYRKGRSAFIRSRLIRIAVPFVVGGFILRPLVVSSWVMGGESMRGEVNILNGLKTGFQTLGQSPLDQLSGSHLWFLYYLLLITAIVLVIRAGGSRIPGLQTAATKRIDQAVAWIANSRISLLVLSLPTGVLLWNMNDWGMDTPDKSLVPHVPVLMVYGGFFALGWLLHRQRDLLGRFARISTGRVVLCAISVGGTLALSAFRAELGDSHPGLMRAGFSFSYAMMMWSLVTLSIGLFRLFFDRPRKAVRYVADSSYWLYLIHLPIVVWLQIAFAELSFHWSLKLIAISVCTVGISLVLYDLFVRSTLIGRILNGQRKERVLSGWSLKRGTRPRPGMPGGARESC